MFRALVHFSIAAAVAAPAFAQVFKWVDERGITHYGERPPQGAKASEVQDKLASPPPGRVPTRPAQKEGPAGAPGFPTAGPSPSTPPPAAPASKAPLTPEEAVAAARKANCDKERAALDLLKRGGTSYSYDAKGERVKIDNSEAITQQEKRVGEQCGS